MWKEGQWSNDRKPFGAETNCPVILTPLSFISFPVLCRRFDYESQYLFWYTAR